MHYAVYKLGDERNLITTDTSVCNAVGMIVWHFRNVELFSWPMWFEMVALKSDGTPDRRYVPTRFKLDRWLRIDCTARTFIGRLVRRAISYM